VTSFLSVKEFHTELDKVGDLMTEMQGYDSHLLGMKSVF